jgi:hypothetical protein
MIFFETAPKRHKYDPFLFQAISHNRNRNALLSMSGVCDILTGSIHNAAKTLSAPSLAETKGRVKACKNLSTKA